jgi:serine/threonine protein kinase
MNVLLSTKDVNNLVILCYFLFFQYRGQDVAVKILKIQDLPTDMLDEFDREIDLMNKLRHKNIGNFCV